MQRTGDTGHKRFMQGPPKMTKLFNTILVQIRKADAAIIERGRPPRRGFEIAVHGSAGRRHEERPAKGGRAPRYR